LRPALDPSEPPTK